jgi:hypothetical protein
VVDVAWLETAFDLQKEQSYKSTLVGKSKVLTVERFRSLLGEMAEFAKVGDE